MKRDLDLEERNKALVLEAFDALFNFRYSAAFITLPKGRVIPCNPRGWTR
jgi:hypothetical protein